MAGKHENKRTLNPVEGFINIQQKAVSGFRKRESRFHERWIIREACA